MPKTRTASSTSTSPKRTTKSKARPSHDDIALRAYQIYVERGCTPGDPMEDWLRAEHELSAEPSPKKPRRKTKVVSIAA